MAVFSTHSKKTGTLYYLNVRDTKLKGGRTQRIYYFSKDVRKEGINAVPAGYVIGENARTGLPFLKKG